MELTNIHKEVVGGDVVLSSLLPANPYLILEWTFNNGVVEYGSSVTRPNNSAFSVVL